MNTTPTDEQLRQAKQMWLEGFSVGEISVEMNCSVHDLTPWLISGERAALEAEEEMRALGALIDYEPLKVSVIHSKYQAPGIVSVFDGKEDGEKLVSCPDEESTVRIYASLIEAGIDATSPTLDLRRVKSERDAVEAENVVAQLRLSRAKLWAYPAVGFLSLVLFVELYVIAKVVFGW